MADGFNGWHIAEHVIALIIHGGLGWVLGWWLGWWKNIQRIVDYVKINTVSEAITNDVFVPSGELFACWAAVARESKAHIVLIVKKPDEKVVREKIQKGQFVLSNSEFSRDFSNVEEIVRKIFPNVDGTGVDSFATLIRKSHILVFQIIKNFDLSSKAEQYVKDFKMVDLEATLRYTPERISDHETLKWAIKPLLINQNQYRGLVEKLTSNTIQY